MCALRKLQESGFYWGAVGGREASSMLRSEPPGTFLIRDSSDHHHFFTLSVQTARGTKNLRIHSEGGGFFLQPDPQNTQELPQFDCVLKLIAHYMGKGPDAGRSRDGACGGEVEMKGRSVYLIHTGGERVPLELRRPLSTSLASLQHMCRRTLNNRGLGGPERAEQLPHTLRDFLEEYDAPIWLTGPAEVPLHGPRARRTAQTSSQRIRGCALHQSLSCEVRISWSQLCFNTDGHHLPKVPPPPPSAAADLGSGKRSVIWVTNDYLVRPALQKNKKQTDHWCQWRMKPEVKGRRFFFFSLRLTQTQSRASQKIRLIGR